VVEYHYSIVYATTVESKLVTGTTTTVSNESTIPNDKLE
jgi:hypothetical protein